MTTIKALILTVVFGFSACQGAFEIEGNLVVSEPQVDMPATPSTKADSPADDLVPPQVVEEVEDPALIAEGLYLDYCGACHGDDASGARAWPLSIQQYDPIAPVLQQGQGKMNAIPALDEQEIAMIQEHLRTLRTY